MEANNNDAFSQAGIMDQESFEEQKGVLAHAYTLLLSK